MSILAALAHGLAVFALIALPYASFVWLLDWFYRWLAHPSDATPARDLVVAVGVLGILLAASRAYVVWWVMVGRRG